MTPFIESKTGLGLILPEAENTAWENIFWQNQHLIGWVLEAQNRMSRLFSGSLVDSTLTGVKVNWVLDDKTSKFAEFPDITITSLPCARMVYYADFDTTTILVRNLASFSDFTPTDKQFPLVHVGTQQKTDGTTPSFAHWVAPRTSTPPWRTI
ncbi:MAG: hypothetical protein A2527_00505 [Candidatus Lambdaproteobacteria bacterium RIFOXYD2_FULL_50_16]|uniref:Uncharacterized protein n=1 Tax=Candidatus Lambdaproteobacteria bacterium RIFOXYD2_FULL_50_16 TaxID=1817772 RepID=A0A1F6G877_9PROT|nr:MAG: hypothetical protein A2527_00505 [Candidatus Lambdaproteobacteria bacterium RIFOXYD2_FULL_50_16]